MGICCSAFRKRRPRGEEREPLLPKYAPEIPPQSQFDKAADIIAALSAGKYPSQEQINRALRLLLNSDVFKTGNLVVNTSLSLHGKKVLDDVRDILHALISLGVEKNGISGLLLVQRSIMLIANQETTGFKTCSGRYTIWRKYL
jgi:hypothetical protein